MTRPTTTDPAELSAIEQLMLFRRKELSPVEVAKAALARIANHDKAVNAFCHLDEAGALAAARDSEKRWQAGEPKGLIDGVPVTVKDLNWVRDWPTGRGSRLMDRKKLEAEDAPAVARLREEGAVFLGKTTTPEFGWKGITDSPLTGVTRNPWNTERTPGGSSGGAAAAAVLGMGTLHTGTDGAGSIRIPSGFSGCFGLKPSFGTVPLYPASPYGSIAVLGPMTRTVSDAALMMSVMARPDTRDANAQRGARPDYRVGLNDGVRGLRIAYSPKLGGHVRKVDAEVAKAIEGAVEVLADLGAHVELADPELPGDMEETLLTVWRAGCAMILDGFGKVRTADLDPGYLAMAEAGRTVTAADFLRAGAKRAELSERMRRFHERFDLLVTPTLPLPAFEAGHDVPRTGGWAKDWWQWTPFTYPFNLTQQPGSSCPAGFTKAGLPIGLQIIGPLGSDALVLRASRAFESERPFIMADRPRSPD